MGIQTSETVNLFFLPLNEGIRLEQENIGKISFAFALLHHQYLQWNIKSWTRTILLKKKIVHRGPMKASISKCMGSASECRERRAMQMPGYMYP